MEGEKKEDNGHFSSAYDLKTADQTRDHYSSWAQSYDREVGEENGYAQPARTAEMLRRFRPSQTTGILDAGCGSGLSGVALADAGYGEIDGCDFSPEMLEKARDKAVYRTLFHADLNAGLPSTPTAQYQAVVCVGVFSFGHVMPDALDEMLRVLKPGGHLIIGLNDPFWQRGDLADKIDEVEHAGQIKVLAKEYGDHLPGHDVMGWVIAIEKV